MTGLAQAASAQELIPGDPGAVAGVAGQMYSYAGLLTGAGEGLSRIDTAGGWSGAAADAFRARFKGQPRAWLHAGACFTQAARALDSYVEALGRAQGLAGTAIEQWRHGDKEAAQATLSEARRQADSAARTAASAVGQARDQAPASPGFWSDVGHFFGGLGHHLENAGADTLNALASLGNAAINHPLDGLGMLGGAALTTVSGAGEALGVAADGTVVLSPAGAALNVASAAGIATGVGMMAASGNDLFNHASGDDKADPVSANSGGGNAGQEDEPPFPAPKEITGRTAHGEERIQGREGHGVNDEALQDAVQNPIRPPQYRPDQYGGAYRYVGRNATVNLNSKGEVTSAWPRNRLGWRHP